MTTGSETPDPAGETVSANRWRIMIENDPEHSHRYAQRWVDMAAAGHDLGGEARLIDAMVDRGARIFDAGCGTGRVGGLLAAQGHDVVGMDLDPYLIEQAQAQFPAAQWSVGDLETFDPADFGPGFDVVFTAGNVLGFLDPDLRPGAIAKMAQLLVPGGRLVTGFGAGRGYSFADFIADQQAAGLNIDLKLSTWDLRPFTDDSGFLVCIASRPAGESSGETHGPTAEVAPGQPRGRGIGVPRGSGRSLL